MNFGKFFATILIVVGFIQPWPVIEQFSIISNLPDELGSSGEFLPASFQFFWFLLSIFIIMFMGKAKETIVSKDILYLIFLSGLSYAGGLFVDSEYNDGWMPLFTLALGLIIFVPFTKREVVNLLDLIMAANILTIPIVFAIRLQTGNELFRLNPFGLNVNSTALLYSLWFLHLSYRKSTFLPIDINKLVLASIGVIIVSGGRTGMAIVLADYLKYIKKFSLKNIFAIIVAALVIGSFFYMRVAEPEDHGADSPPANIADSYVSELGAVGRIWSISAGIDALTLALPIGFNSVYDTVYAVRESGYRTFPHSTFLVLLLLYGFSAIPIFCWIIGHIFRSKIVITAKICLLLTFLFSGGLITNGKEIILLYLLLNLLPRDFSEV